MSSNSMNIVYTFIETYYMILVNEIELNERHMLIELEVRIWHKLRLSQNSI